MTTPDERKAARLKVTQEGTGIVFVGLRVTVKDGSVMSWPGAKRTYGALEGARAEVTHPVRDRATALVIFADGTTHERKLNGSVVIRRAQADAVRFTAFAGASS
jgi:hypothetical protein